MVRERWYRDGQLDPPDCSTHNIRSIVVPLASSIDQQVQLSAQGGIIGYVVKSGSGSSSGQNGMVGHLGSGVGHTSLQKGGVELLLRGCGLGTVNDGSVSAAGNMICFLDHGNLKVILDDAGNLNGGLDCFEILLGEL